MRPRADEVMDSIIWTFDQHVLPAVEGALPKSLALTMSNLLRHVRIRMEQEAPALLADNADLREVLGSIASFIERQSPGPQSLAALSESLTHASLTRDSADYQSLNVISAQAQQLRGVLDDALRALQEAREALGDTAEYQALRSQIREYLARQLERESAWIKDAFTNARR